MKTVLFVTDDSYGEVEAFFNEDGTLLGSWSRNDAEWRREYFDPILAALGITFVKSTRPDLLAKLRDHWRF